MSLGNRSAPCARAANAPRADSAATAAAHCAKASTSITWSCTTARPNAPTATLHGLITKSWTTRQVFELPMLRAQVTEHRLMRSMCRCGAVHLGAFPPDINAPAQHGPRAKARALAAHLNQHHLVPLQRTTQVMRDAFGLKCHRPACKPWGRPYKPPPPCTPTPQAREAQRLLLPGCFQHISPSAQQLCASHRRRAVTVSVAPNRGRLTAFRLVRRFATVPMLLLVPVPVLMPVCLRACPATPLGAKRGAVAHQS